MSVIKNDNIELAFLYRFFKSTWKQTFCHNESSEIQTNEHNYNYLLKKLLKKVLCIVLILKNFNFINLLNLTY